MGEDRKAHWKTFMHGLKIPPHYGKFLGYLNKTFHFHARLLTQLHLIGGNVSWIRWLIEKTKLKKFWENSPTHWTVLIINSYSVHILKINFQNKQMQKKKRKIKIYFLLTYRTLVPIQVRSPGQVPSISDTAHF